MRQHVFLVGAKGLGNYGGYETFINKLTEYHQCDDRIRYHIACKANGEGHIDETKMEGIKILNDMEFVYHNAHCFKIYVPEKFGSAQAIYYDVMSLKKCCEIIQSEKIQHPIIYVMACRIGPFMKMYHYKIHKLGGKVYLNPDGHEWMRTKWNFIIRKYWKLSEQLMVKYSDLIICDSKEIQKYIHQAYDNKGIKGVNPNTTFIAYGTEIRKSKIKSEDRTYRNWLQRNGLISNEYYLIVGRFVPENNYETMIREFMESASKKNLAIITNRNDKLYKKLEETIHFMSDSRIKFVGPLYDEELLMKVRENAYGYIHGHEVGGTNPSLLEAMSATQLNLLLDVEFNKEVGEDSVLYWNKTKGSLASIINQAEKMSIEDIKGFEHKAKSRIQEAYSWSLISDLYMDIFLLKEHES